MIRWQNENSIFDISTAFITTFILVTYCVILLIYRSTILQYKLFILLWSHCGKFCIWLFTLVIFFPTKYLFDLQSEKHWILSFLIAIKFNKTSQENKLFSQKPFELESFKYILRKLKLMLKQHTTCKLCLSLRSCLKSIES